jgi:precorrin-8X/cobalt-precorrin-8 methylmutase
MEKGLKIETDSFEIINKLVDLSNFKEDEKIIVRKLIHTTGDTEFAKLTIISDNAIVQGIDAIRSGKPIVCDVNMVKTGITKRYSSDFGNEIFCFINDKHVLNISSKCNLTRSEVAIEYAVNKYPDAIFAIGNAPTALLKLLELTEQNKAFPSFIAGLPVGFVKAEESKVLLADTNLPFVTNKGTKGGSPCAATVINGLFIIAKEF